MSIVHGDRIYQPDSRFRFRYGKIAHDLSGILGDGNLVDYGILQNQYSFGVDQLNASGSFDDLDDVLRIGPQYNRNIQ